MLLHVTARGNERKPICREDRDREHFLTLSGELAERFGVRMHAYTLLDNHYHLLVETPEANLSRAMQWLNASYSVWFNRRHARAGHLFEGRFAAVAVEDGAGWQKVARYVHLNPVRVAGRRLSKRARTASRAGLVGKPGAPMVAERLRRLRAFRWSSCGWPAIVKAVTAVKGEKWEDFKERHGDWGRDAALWLGRRRGRYRLGELGKLAEGMDYAAVG